MSGYRILIGDVLDRLRELPDASVQCVVTSPPYFGLRDYGVAGQIGLERTPAEYLDRLVAVFREVRRVLRADGTCWVNMGDSYCASPGQRKVSDVAGTKQISNVASTGTPSRVAPGLKPKDLMGMPWRLAFALQEDGWWLRQDLIWAKPNPMPESVTDRCTKAHEYLFLLTKSANYSYDADAIKEASVTGDERRPYTSQGALEMDGRPEEQRHGGKPRNGAYSFRGQGAERDCSTGPANRDGRDMSLVGVGATRNKRSVWDIATEPFTQWGEICRQVRVSWDAAGDDTVRTTSPGCPLHGDSSAPASSVSCGGREAAPPSRTQRSGGDRVQVPAPASAPIDPTPYVGLPPGSSGSQAPLHSPTATVHSNQSRRTDLSLSTTLPYNAFAQTPDGMSHTEASPQIYDSAEHRNANSNGADSEVDESNSSPSEQTEPHNASNCTCSYHNTVTEKLSHFATFPTKLVEPCILAGSRPGDMVLDCFSGSGTVGVVALRYGRSFTGIELSPTYAAMSIRRIVDDAPLLRQHEVPA